MNENKKFEEFLKQVPVDSPSPELFERLSKKAHWNLEKKRKKSSLLQWILFATALSIGATLAILQDKPSPPPPVENEIKPPQLLVVSNSGPEIKISELGEISIIRYRSQANFLISFDSERRLELKQSLDWL
ncbi:MAG: hypothetical protein HQM08_16090 [Candidatus Riflebacteria bacterium]|nr:hypothetical protein [Candidatus Riflebacteria bacterium]